MKILDAKASVDKELKNTLRFPSGSSTEFRAKEGFSGSTKRQTGRPLCHIDGHLSSWQCGVRTNISEVLRQTRIVRWHCKRRLWSVHSFYWTRLVCVANDCSKSNGCHCKTTCLLWTSSRRSVRVHPSKNGGCSQTVQNPKVRMSRYMDTSSTT